MTGATLAACHSSATAFEWKGEQSLKFFSEAKRKAISKIVERNAPFR